MLTLPKRPKYGDKTSVFFLGTFWFVSYAFQLIVVSPKIFLFWGWGVGGPLYSDSNSKKKSNDEIFSAIFCLSVHPREDVKFCSK